MLYTRSGFFLFAFSIDRKKSWNNKTICGDGLEVIEPDRMIKMERNWNFVSDDRKNGKPMGMTICGDELEKREERIHLERSLNTPIIFLGYQTNSNPRYQRSQTSWAELHQTRYANNFLNLFPTSTSSTHNLSYSVRNTVYRNFFLFLIIKKLNCSGQSKT